jgi:hypothetical protein
LNHFFVYEKHCFILRNLLNDFILDLPINIINKAEIQNFLYTSI